MTIKINGEEKQLEQQVNISNLLVIHNVQMPEMVSVELNGEILDKEDFDTTFVRDGDVLEFLYFMGGGAIGF